MPPRGEAHDQPHNLIIVLPKFGATQGTFYSPSLALQQFSTDTDVQWPLLLSFREGDQEGICLALDLSSALNANVLYYST